MTISSSNRKAGPFTGNGVTVAFPFAFKVFTTADVLVVQAVTATGVETTLALGTNYTVTLNADQNANPGGTLTMLVAPPTGYTLTATSQVGNLQPMDLTNAGGFYPKVLNDAADRAAIQVQQLNEGLGRSLKFPVSDGDYDPTMPGKSQRLGRVLAFHETTGDPVQGPSIGDVGTVSGNIANVATVASNIANVNTVASDIANVNIVAHDIGNMNTVAENIGSVNTVAGSIADVNTVAENLSDVTNFSNVYLGPRVSNPITRSNGSALQNGDIYFNTATNRMMAYANGVWYTTETEGATDAALVSYTPGGVGAVPTTAQTELRRAINPKNFGCVGDGVTDDTVNFQKALVAAAGRTLQCLDSGTYFVYALKVYANTVVDLGAATIKKRPATISDQTLPQFTGNSTVWWSTSAALMAPLFYVVGDNVVFKGGTLDGNRSAETYQTGTWGGSFAVEGNRCGILASHSAIDDVKSLTVSGVKFRNLFGDSIVTEYMTGTLTVENCTEDNAGAIFIYSISQWNAPYTQAGNVFFTGNKLGGVRNQNNVRNPGVVEGTSLVMQGNIIDGSAQDLSGGFKIQGISNVSCVGNVFIKEYLKPQSQPGWMGDTFVFSNNICNSTTPDTHITGLIMGYHSMKSLTASGNNIVNGSLSIERASLVVNCVNNLIKWDVNPTIRVSAISGGANGAAAGKAVIANNTVELGGLDNVAFFYPPADCGTNILVGNTITNATHAWYFQHGASVLAASEIQIIGNSFTNCRSIGRINIPSAMKGLVIKNNTFTNCNPTAAPNYGTTSPAFVVTFTAAAYTVDSVVIDGNYFDRSYAVPSYGYPTISCAAGPTVTDFVFTKNIFAFNSLVNGWSFGMNAAAMTFSNVYVFDNHLVGDFAFNSGATITNQHISGNSFTGAGRKVLNTTKKVIDINGSLTTTVGAAGGATALPATPLGYVTVTVDGTDRKIPYYNA